VQQYFIGGDPVGISTSTAKRNEELAPARLSDIDVAKFEVCSPAEQLADDEKKLTKEQAEW
jgi:hypothetical protein